MENMYGIKRQLIHEQEKCLEQGREIKRLQAIVGKLTKTKDDVPVVPDVDKVFWPGNRTATGTNLVLIDATVALDVGLGGCVLHRSYRVFDRNGHAVLVSDSYSTMEAAEAAEAEKKPA